MSFGFEGLIAIFLMFVNFVFLNITSLMACCASSVYDPGIICKLCVLCKYIFTEECTFEIVSFLSCNCSNKFFNLGKTCNTNERFSTLTEHTFECKSFNLSDNLMNLF
jgi:hypothetical protein